MTAAALTAKQVTALVEGMRARGLRLGVDAHIRAQRVLRLCGVLRASVSPSRCAPCSRRAGDERDDAFRDVLATITAPPPEAPPTQPTAPASAVAERASRGGVDPWAR